MPLAHALMIVAGAAEAVPSGPTCVITSASIQVGFDGRIQLLGCTGTSADVRNLGIVLWEATTGETFDDRRPSEVVAHYPRALEVIVLAAIDGTLESPKALAMALYDFAAIRALQFSTDRFCSYVRRSADALAAATA